MDQSVYLKEALPKLSLDSEIFKVCQPIAITSEGKSVCSTESSTIPSFNNKLSRCIPCLEGCA